LKYKNGIDKESNGALFEANELARRKFISQRLANNDFNVNLTLPENENIENQIASSADELNEVPAPRLPRSIETVKLNKRVAFEPTYSSNQNSKDDLNRTDEYSNNTNIRTSSPTFQVNESPKNAFKANLMKKNTIYNNNSNLESILKKPSSSYSQPIPYSLKKDAIHTEI
jgi:hypothetical protein